MDLIICLAAMPLLAPILILCTLAVRLESRGPIFFR
jgi:lipopolysaccharide/colanic/teichoic acid biosynthesis glycosyltransferase